MKTKKIFFFAVLFAFGFLSINSCKKEDTTNTNTTSASNCVIAENCFSDVKNIMDEAGFKNGAFNGTLNDTAITVSFDSLNHSDLDTITIDFGTTNLLCNDSRLRKGKIITTYNGHYSDTSKTHTTTFLNYSVDNNRVNGVLKDSYKGYNSSGHLHFHDTISGNITLSTGKNIGWTSTTKLEFASGDSTDTWSDKTMLILGNASGSTSDGDGFSMLISSPIKRNFSNGCRKYLVSGTIQIALSSSTYLSADLGNSDCEDLISVTIDGNNYQVHTN